MTKNPQPNGVPRAFNDTPESDMSYPSTAESQNTLNETFSSNPVYAERMNIRILKTNFKRSKSEASSNSSRNGGESRRSKRFSPLVRKASKTKNNPRSISLPDLRGTNNSSSSSRKNKKFQLNSKQLPDINIKISDSRSSAPEVRREILMKNHHQSLTTMTRRITENNAESTLTGQIIGKENNGSEVIKEHIQWITTQIQQATVNSESSKVPPDDPIQQHLPIIHQSRLDGGEMLVVSLMKNQENQSKKDFVKRLKLLKLQLEENLLLKFELKAEQLRYSKLSKQFEETTMKLHKARDLESKQKVTIDIKIKDIRAQYEKEFRDKLEQQERTLRAEMKLLEQQLGQSQAALVATQRQLFEAGEKKDNLVKPCEEYKEIVKMLQEQKNFSENVSVSVDNMRVGMEKNMEAEWLQKLKVLETETNRKIQLLEQDYQQKNTMLQDAAQRSINDLLKIISKYELKSKESSLKITELEKDLLKSQNEILKLQKEQSEQLTAEALKIKAIHQEYNERMIKYEEEINTLNSEAYKLKSELHTRIDSVERSNVDNEEHLEQASRLLAMYENEIGVLKKEIDRLSAYQIPTGNEDGLHRGYQERIRRLEASHEQQISKLLLERPDVGNESQPIYSNESKINEIHAEYQEKISNLQDWYEDSIEKLRAEIIKLNNVNKGTNRREIGIQAEEETSTRMKLPDWCCLWYCRCFGFTSKRVAPDEELVTGAANKK